jgi:hypothetical protein
LKPHQRIQRLLCLVIIISSVIFLNGCSSTITAEEDLIRLVKKGDLPRQILDNIVYEVRQKIEQDTHSGFALDMDNYEDRLAYWMSAEMADMRGIITRKYSGEPAPTDTQATIAPEILSVKTEILFTGFFVSDDKPVWQYVLAELTYEDEQWVVQKYDFEDNDAVDPNLALEGVMLKWLHNKTP